MGMAAPAGEFVTLQLLQEQSPWQTYQMISIPPSRRQFMQFLGAGGVIAAGTRILPGWLCARDVEGTGSPAHAPFFDGIRFAPVPPDREDRLQIPEGYQQEVLLRRGDVINSRGEQYGDCNDFVATISRGPDTAWLWVNHEAVHFAALHGPGVVDLKAELSDDSAAKCLQMMGGTCLELKRNANGRWRPVVPGDNNFRVDGISSKLRFTGPAAGSPLLGGSTGAIGTLANCGGGVSPWGTFFSAEENFQDFVGCEEMKEKPVVILPEKFLRPQSHYGYMVEVDPDTRELFKHTALGRFSHENIAFTLTKDGRLAAYMGDDKANQHLYKFISRGRYQAGRNKANRTLLNDGDLFAADVAGGKWKRLADAPGFDAARICVNTRQAAEAAGASPLPRPEDVEVHPLTGDVYVALTAWQPEKPGPAAWQQGAIARLKEAGGDPGALEFTWEVFVRAGEEAGLAWPDNLTFAPDGTVLTTTDWKMAAETKPGTAQEHFGNNMLAVVETEGPDAGKVRRFATAPPHAEFCSPILSPCRNELWVSVQHPGLSEDMPDKLSSHWPDGGEAKQSSALVCISRA